MEQSVIIPNRKEHRASVIWLHGLGADGYDFAPVVEELHLPHQDHIKFIFPHAPVRPVSINGGMPMRAWFDIDDISLELSAPLDEIEEAYQLIANIIDQEIASGVASHHIVLAGFSQGGALTLYIALKYPHPLGALIGLSCFIPDHNIIERIDHHQFDTPLFLGHGNKDPIVPLSLGEFTRDKLQSLGFQVEWHLYDMAHSVCPAQIADLRGFLHNIGRE